MTEQKGKYAVTVNTAGYGEPVNPQEYSISKIADAMTIEQFVYLFSEYLNRHWGDRRSGEQMGRAFHSEHRTIQGSAVEFCLGFLIGISDQQYTDPRNDVAIRNAKDIARMLEDGTLSRQPLI